MEPESDARIAISVPVTAAASSASTAASSDAFRSSTAVISAPGTTPHDPAVGAATTTNEISTRLGENDGVVLDEGTLFARGIRANVVAPGVIRGGMADDTFSDEAIRQMVPAGRAGTPGEVAALVGFLCSDAAGYINGQVIGINGGMG